MKTLEVKAGGVEEAIEKGLIELNKTREEVDIEVVDAGGFLKKAKVILTVKPTEGEKALDFLQKLLEKMNLNVSVAIKEEDDKIELTVSGADSGSVIGYRGDVLDSLQYIVSVSVNKGREEYKKIIIDCENYRLRRTETLESLAAKLAEKAIEKGRKISLEPMNPFERRIIHSALQSNDLVTTESEGTEPNRYIVIKPKNLKPYEDRPYRKDRPYTSRERGGSPYRGGSNSEGGYKGINSTDSDSRGGYKKQGGGYADRQAPKRNSSFGFGTYLGNTKSGFTSENDFTKKSGFDNLKD